MNFQTKILTVKLKKWLAEYSCHVKNKTYYQIYHSQYLEIQPAVLIVLHYIIPALETKKMRIYKHIHIYTDTYVCIRNGIVQIIMQVKSKMSVKYFLPKITESY